MKIVSLNIALPQEVTFNGKTYPSAFRKQSVDQPVFLTKLGFDGDGVGNPIYHGGVDKAVCVYSYTRYSYWENTLNKTLDVPSFGENITVEGWTEEEVCVGDTFQLGEAVVQVTEPRQPCWKINDNHDSKELLKLVLKSGFTGFYLRVLEEGHVSCEDQLIRISQHPAKMSIMEANNIIFCDVKNVEGIQRLLAIDEIAQSLRNSLEKKLQSSE